MQVYGKPHGAIAEEGEGGLLCAADRLNGYGSPLPGFALQNAAKCLIFGGCPAYRFAPKPLKQPLSCGLQTVYPGSIPGVASSFKIKGLGELY
jgi:hypothetical protein